MKFKYLFMVLFVFFCTISLPADSSGDDYADLVIGVPHFTIPGYQQPGRINVVYGASGGLTGTDSEYFQLDEMGYNIDSYTNFGDAIAMGDFNGDGLFDLAVGAPGQEVGGYGSVGAVYILYNDNKDGLVKSKSEEWDQERLRGSYEPGDGFGYTLAAGDFNGDGVSDLVIGIENKNVLLAYDAGAVQVMYGSAYFGVTAAGNTLLSQGTDAMSGEKFGHALAVGDFNNDGNDDLAVGVPFDWVGGLYAAGGVNIYYGDPDEGITNDNSTDYWHQDRTDGENDVKGEAEAGDSFGYSLATGDFNNDGYDDLAVGVMGERIGDVEGAIQAGAVNVLYGSSDGITSVNNQMWHQNAPGVVGEAEPQDYFGRSLTAGDFNGDGYSELAIGIPGEDIDSVEDTGMVQILIGSDSGLTADGRLGWHQDSSGILDSEEPDDQFGWALSAGDFNHDGYEDLVVGVPFEDVGMPVKVDAGLIHVIYGSDRYLTANGNQVWYAGYNGLPEPLGGGDSFGYSLPVNLCINLGPPPADHSSLSSIIQLLLLGD